MIFLLTNLDLGKQTLLQEFEIINIYNYYSRYIQISKRRAKAHSNFTKL